MNCVIVDDEEAANNDEPPYSSWYIAADYIYSEDCILGIEDNTITNFTLFPNPVKDILNLTAKETINSVSISNVLGQVVFNSNIDALEATIDMSGYANGTYFMKVTFGNETFFKKIIKE